MDIPPDKPGAKHWRQKFWAKLPVKRREKLWKEDVSSDFIEKDWKAYREEYELNPKEFVAKIQRELDGIRDIVPRLVDSGSVIIAADSNDSRLVGMQHIIDELANVFGLASPPKLLVHRSSSPYDFAHESVIDISLNVPEFIDINQYTKKYFLDRPNQFKAIVAHELAHIVNQDYLAENIAMRKIRPPNQMMEVLAERMGAIIHGNPKKYAEDSSRFSFRFAKKYSIDSSLFTPKYLSANGNARMLHHWADILAEQDATDSKGNINLEPDDKGVLRPLKALAVFERSKEFTESLLVELLNLGIAQPSPRLGR